MLSFKYEEETKRWIANYKVETFDLQGDWNLQLIQNYKENEKEELLENEVKVPLIRINNEMPTIDKEMPKLHNRRGEGERNRTKTRRFYTCKSEGGRRGIGCERSSCYIKRKRK